MREKPGFLRRALPLFAVYAFWAAGTVILSALILRQTGGRFIYNLDDAYIHLAMAKHAAVNGVWGVTPYAFSSSSSSTLWTLLLAGAFRFFGVREIVPFLFSLASSICLIGLLYREWTQAGHSAKWSAGLMALCIAFLPFWPALFNGMETMLHAVLAVGLGAAGVRYLLNATRRDLFLLLGMAFLAAAARYESCFLVAVICLLLALRRRWKEALAVGAAALAPVAAYGVFSMSNGWLFLPNSILLKRSPVDLTTLSGIWAVIIRPVQPVIDREVSRLPVWQSIAFLVLVLLLHHARAGSLRSVWNDRVLPAMIFLAAGFLHSVFITNDWFFRYQMYLVILGIWALGSVGPPTLDGTVFRRRIPALAMAVGAAAVVLFPVVSYAVRATLETPVAAGNIWEQQYQMGIFLKDYFPGGQVAANDIGAVNYLNDQHFTDLYGLATMRVLKEKLNGNWNRDLPAVLDSITGEEDVRIVVIYNNWFGYHDSTGAASVPERWVKVADWTISDNVVCGGKTVTWYAVRAEDAGEIQSALKDFAVRLPAGVAVRNYFTN